MSEDHEFVELTIISWVDHTVEPHIIADPPEFRDLVDSADYPAKVTGCLVHQNPAEGVLFGISNRQHRHPTCPAEIAHLDTALCKQTAKGSYPSGTAESRDWHQIRTGVILESGQEVYLDSRNRLHLWMGMVVDVGCLQGQEGFWLAPGHRFFADSVGVVFLDPSNACLRECRELLGATQLCFEPASPYEGRIQAFDVAQDFVVTLQIDKHSTKMSTFRREDCTELKSVVLDNHNKGHFQTMKRHDQHIFVLRKLYKGRSQIVEGSTDMTIDMHSLDSLTKLRHLRFSSCPVFPLKLQTALYRKEVEKLGQQGNRYYQNWKASRQATNHEDPTGLHTILNQRKIPEYTGVPDRIGEMMIFRYGTSHNTKVIVLKDHLRRLHFVVWHGLRLIYTDTLCLGEMHYQGYKLLSGPEQKTLYTITPSGGITRIRLKLLKYYPN